MDIRDSKARWSDWTRSACLKRPNPIYVCNEVYSLRTPAMCSRREHRGQVAPEGQVLLPRAPPPHPQEQEIRLWTERSGSDEWMSV